MKKIKGKENICFIVISSCHSHYIALSHLLYIILSHFLTYCCISGSISLSHLLLYFRIHFTISLIVVFQDPFHYLTYCYISGSISLSHLLLYYTISLFHYLTYCYNSGSISLSHVLLYFRIHFTISLIVIFQDPFGEKRGIYDYENIFKRLESIKKVLSEKHQSSEDTESSDTDLDISSTER